MTWFCLPKFEVGSAVQSEARGGDETATRKWRRYRYFTIMRHFGSANRLDTVRSGFCIKTWPAILASTCKRAETFRKSSKCRAAGLDFVSVTVSPQYLSRDSCLLS
jgi:hypothetical protein